MVWMKRIVLFVLVNILVMVTISTVASFFGIGNYMGKHGLDLKALAAFCLLWGMAGSFISLAMSRIMAKWMMGVRVIDPKQASLDERKLVESVHALARRAGISVSPQVGIYDSEEINAFATGPTKNRALVAVSTGLLRSMNSQEVEGVLGHEIAHVANGDMVTMTLIQGIVNAFAMFFSRVIAWAVSQNVREDMRWGVRFAVTIVLDIVLTLLGSIVVAYFSRWREFRADAGGANFAGKNNMVSALRALQSRYEPSPNQTNSTIATLKIAGRSMGSLARLFSTHPPLSERIARLESRGVASIR